MSDKVEQIAIASVTASTSGAEFVCNCGFSSVTRNGAGDYTLKLKEGHRTSHLVVLATRNNLVNGSIAASLTDREHIQILTFDEDSVPADSAFFVEVKHVDVD